MFIGVLGFLGVVVPLIRTDIGKREKAVWTAVLALLLWAELRSIHLDQIQHDREQDFARCEQLESFKAIATALGDSIKTSQNQYESTISHVDGVARTTQEVSSLAKKNLQNVTGGDSYAYLLPEPVENALGYSANLFNDGNNVLTGITVRVSTVLADRGGNQNYYIDQGAIHAIPMNTLGPHSHALLSDYWFYPVKDGVPQKHFIAIITAQNGDVYQDIYFRRALSGKGYAFMFTVKRVVRPAPKGKPDALTIVKTWGWTEPTPPL